MPDRMTWEERWKRDGDRWRFIFLLEQELENRTIKRRYLLASFIINVLLAVILIWQIAA